MVLHVEEHGTWVQTSALLLTSFVTLSKSLNFSVSLFLHVQDEGDNIPTS